MFQRCTRVTYENEISFGTCGMHQGSLNILLNFELEVHWNLAIKLHHSPLFWYYDVAMTKQFIRESFAIIKTYFKSQTDILNDYLLRWLVTCDPYLKE